MDENTSIFQPSKNLAAAIKWLLKAASKDAAREALTYIHVPAPGYLEATDGFRIHRLRLGFTGELAELAPGLYNFRFEGKTLWVERQVRVEGEPELPHFPDIDGFLAYSQGLDNQATPEDEDEGGKTKPAYLYLQAQGLLLAETFSVPVTDGAVIVSVEIGRQVRIHAHRHEPEIDYLAVVMPMTNAPSKSGMPVVTTERHVFPALKIEQAEQAEQG